MSVKRSFGILSMIGLLIIAALVSNPTVKASNNVTLKYAFWGNPDAIGVEKDIIDEFEKANPGVKVQPVVSSYADYHTKLLVMIAGGVCPDIIRVNSFFFEDFLKVKALQDITSLIKRDKINLNLYYKTGLSENSYKGKYYGLPWGTAPSYMAINLKMFKKAGIPAPSYDWTWNDFVNICKKIGRGTGNERQYAYGDTLEMEYLLPFVWGTGVDLFDKTHRKFTLNRPAAVKRIQEMADLIKEGLIAEPAMITTSQDIRARLMINNRLAMCSANCNDVLTMQKLNGLEFEVIPYPGGPVAKNTTIYKSNVMGIYAKTKNLEAAWKFLKFLRIPDGVGEKLYCESKRVPPSVNIPALWDVYSAPNKYPKRIKEVSNLIAAKYAHVFPNRMGWNEVKGLVDPQLQKIFSGQISAKEAMNEITPKVQSVLNRNN